MSYIILILKTFKTSLIVCSLILCLCVQVRVSVSSVIPPVGRVQGIGKTSVIPVRKVSDFSSASSLHISHMQVQKDYLCQMLRAGIYMHVCMSTQVCFSPTVSCVCPFVHMRLTGTRRAGAVKAVQQAV